ncbi:MAG: hypothetical protein OHK0056_06380 [Bacteriovoracaceae bacterium]
MQETWFEQAQNFLKVKEQFMLGELSTERQNPKTIGLAELSQHNLHDALVDFHEVDKQTLRTLINKLPLLEEMADSISETVKSQHRIFFVGCGATGRLSLSIEFLARASGGFFDQQVTGLMAGGDLALIHSIERFEDYPEYAVRQLRDLNFSENDLLIAVTEGGETPFVIGAVEYAAKFSKRKPFFLYCNPDDILKKVAARSKAVLENSAISKINLDVGPMALSGSTRLQATTIQMSACCLALLHYNEKDKWVSLVESMLNQVDSLVHEDFERLIENESQFYQNAEAVLYKVDPFLAIAVMTDTTERSPTFSLASFENRFEPERPFSWCYLYDSEAESAEDAWLKLLMRRPNTLEWPELDGIASMKRLLGFDFSKSLKRHRESGMKCTQHIAQIELHKDYIRLTIGPDRATISNQHFQLWQSHIMLKIALNAHSTLVMGRLKRYQSNIMTYVRPSNNKLIDRATRYIMALLKEQGRTDYSYDQIVMKIFEVRTKISPCQPIVLEVMKEL